MDANFNLSVLSSNQEHRVEEMRSIIAKQKETAQKVAATAFSMGFMADLLSTAFQSLADDGFIYDPVLRGTSVRRQHADYRKYMSLRRQHADDHKYMSLSTAIIRTATSHGPCHFVSPPG